MKDRAAARAAAKKDKKCQQQQQTNKEKALKILSQEGKGSNEGLGYFVGVAPSHRSATQT
jgi:hypothetical protein